MFNVGTGVGADHATNGTPVARDCRGIGIMVGDVVTYPQRHSTRVEIIIGTVTDVRHEREPFQGVKRWTHVVHVHTIDGQDRFTTLVDKMTVVTRPNP